MAERCDFGREALDWLCKEGRAIAAAGHGGGSFLFLSSQHRYVTGELRLNLLVFIPRSWTRVWRVVM